MSYLPKSMGLSSSLQQSAVAIFLLTLLLVSSACGTNRTSTNAGTPTPTLGTQADPFPLQMGQYAWDVHIDQPLDLPGKETKHVDSTTQTWCLAYKFPNLPPEADDGSYIRFNNVIYKIDYITGELILSTDTPIALLGGRGATIGSCKPD
jgi:hypothetical protein